MGLPTDANTLPGANELIKSTVDHAEDLQQQKPNEIPSGLGIFGSFEFEIPVHRFQADWHVIQARIAHEEPKYHACDVDVDACASPMRKWRSVIAELKGDPSQEQLSALNSSINAMAQYTGDQEAFGRDDYWATPEEFLGGLADCEDFAVIKYRSLLELGYRDDQIRFVIVRDTRRNIMHAVVSVDLNGKQFVLDNLYDPAVEQRNLLRYVPIYSVNQTRQFGHIVTRKLHAAYLAATDTLKADRVTVMSSDWA